MKQREGPLCPCCRRDFVIDPYDVDDEDVFMAELEEDEDDEQVSNGGVQRGVSTRPLEDDDDDEEELATENQSVSTVGGDVTDDLDPVIAAEAAAAQNAALSMHLDLYP